MIRGIAPLTRVAQFSFFQTCYMILSGKTLMPVASVHVSVVAASAIAVITTDLGVGSTWDGDGAGRQQ